jgi:hypothetical protein
MGRGSAAAATCANNVIVSPSSANSIRKSPDERVRATSEPKRPNELIGSYMRIYVRTNANGNKRGDTQLKKEKIDETGIDIMAGTFYLSRCRSCHWVEPHLYYIDALWDIAVYIQHSDTIIVPAVVYTPSPPPERLYLHTHMWVCVCVDITAWVFQLKRNKCTTGRGTAARTRSAVPHVVGAATHNSCLRLYC